jgi:hypothetical protein
MPVKKSTTVTAETEAPPNYTVPFYVGSDPEYLLFYGQRGLNAKDVISNFFSCDPDFTHKPQGYAPIKKLHDSKVGELGWDGASSTGELRPKASKDIRKHVDFLGSMLESIHEKMPYVDITTLSIGSPIGGHVHVDSAISQEEYNSDRKKKAMRKRQNKILMTFLLPIIASDHRISAMARMTGSYGNLGDIRYDQKTNSTTAEIRGLTAEWLTTPKIATSTLAYIACVWHEIQKRTDELYKNPNLIRSQTHADSIHRLLLSDYNLITNALVKDIKSIVKGFELYPQFRAEVDYILNPKRVYADKEKAGWNINKGWKFNSKTQPTKSALLSTSAVQEILTKENVPDIEHNFAVNYNDDYNVSTFAKAISDRVATMNWQLKNSYALFGFRKGATGYTAMTEDNQFFCMSDNHTKDKIMHTSQNMMDRYRGKRHGNSSMDPKTGKTSGKDLKTIVIGIPYDVRAKDDYTEMINLIWEIENGKIKAQAPEAFTVTETVGKNQPQYDMQEVVDNFSTSDSSFNESINSVIREANENNQLCAD